MENVLAKNRVNSDDLALKYVVLNTDLILVWKPTVCKVN
jgi:hypothetical protein